MNTVQHLNAINAALERLAEREVYAIGLAAAERQLPLYTRAMIATPSDASALFRNFLNQVWDWLLEKQPRPVGYGERCEAIIIDQPLNGAQIAAREVTGSMFSIAMGLDDNRPLECQQVLSNGINIIDGFLYDALDLRVTLENSRVVDAHPLTIAECEAQVRDLSDIQHGSEWTGIIEVLRRRSLNKRLLGDYWFD